MSSSLGGSSTGLRDTVLLSLRRGHVNVGKLGTGAAFVTLRLHLLQLVIRLVPQLLKLFGFLCVAVRYRPGIQVSILVIVVIVGVIQRPLFSRRGDGECPAPLLSGAFFVGKVGA